MQAASEPKHLPTTIIGTLSGVTNPESAEMLDDGETIIFGNTTLAFGNPNHRQGKSLFYLKDQAFLSRARFSKSREFTLDAPRLVAGLTGTLGSEVLRKGTATLPPGTGLSACGGRPFALDAYSPMGTPEEARQQVLAFDPFSGKVLGRIALWEGSPIARAIGHRCEMPNGLAVAPNGDIYVADNPNTNPESPLPPPIPACTYRIPAESVDALLVDDEAAAATVRAVENEGWFNGVAASPIDGAAWAVSCSYLDPLKGAIFRIDAADFAAGNLPAPFVTGLGLLDGAAVTKRGTVIASNPLTNDIHVFPTDGTHCVLRVDGQPLPTVGVADVNVIYPSCLDGEPALLMADLVLRSEPGGAQLLIADLTGL